MTDHSSLKRIQPIDIKGVFYSKNPKLARLLPGFVINYLKRIIHQDFFNDMLSRHGDKQNIEFIKAAIGEFNVSIHVEGEENLPPEGRFIFASNHPLGGFDGLVLMKIIDQYYDKYKFLVNDILMTLSNIKDLFIPINKHGSQGMQTIKQINKAFESDIQILTFPSGLVSRKIKGQVMDLPWQKSFILKAIKYHRDIIPVHFSGRNTNFFYNLANFRKFIGIKANIEMLYLADETYKHRNKDLTVKFGEPIPWQTFDNTRKSIEWAKWVKERVYALDNIYNLPL
jgi:1-acyl-sn-glycerol-3-phosphate acyltransferase